MLAHGVEECWLVNPERRIVEVLRGVSGAMTSVDSILTSALLPGFVLAIAEVWEALDR